MTAPLTLPRPLADPIPCVDGRFAVGCLRRQISVPGLRSRARSLRQRLTMIVGARESAEIAAIADAGAGHEEAHVGRLRMGRLSRCRRQHCGGQTKANSRNDPVCRNHRFLRSFSGVCFQHNVII